ncbi:ABC transporter permease [Egibacter rhizosphaerae]|uniref:Transport permease protein n=1 Tax=Egibacter rhizosphaerae TaxID=1670831 RepID=A0A411YE99_9ACTN|nr:ABC transporter permease [Egibacter rhizosphaerae]QBI19583.1 ABC transporter permease [Egibacter rhizosphaerae]
MTTAAAPEQLEQDAVRTVLSTSARPSRPSGLTVSLVFWWRAMLKIKHVPEQLFDVTAFPVMFLLMFTYLFGGALAGSTGAYLQEVLPGILVLTVAMITMYTGLTLNRDIQKGVHDRFRSLPIWRPSTLVGPLLADVVRYTLASTIMITLGLVLGFRPDAGASGMLMAVALLLAFAFSLSWVWTVLGIVMRSENALMGLSMMILFPLTFVSNVFVPPETLPGWLESFVSLNPVTILVTATRGLAHGHAVGTEIGVVLAISAALVAVFGPLTMYVYRRKA